MLSGQCLHVRDLNPLLSHKRHVPFATLFRQVHALDSLWYCTQPDECIVPR